MMGKLVETGYLTDNNCCLLTVLSLAYFIKNFILHGVGNHAQDNMSEILTIN